MQWLIDIIVGICNDYTDAEIAANCGGAGFVDRGDPPWMDWSTNDFVYDSAWRDLDCSGIVPVGTAAVLLRVAWRHFQIADVLRFRKKGHTGWANVAECRLRVANLFYHEDRIVFLDENRLFQYAVDPPKWTDILVTVGGWWGPEA